MRYLPEHAENAMLSACNATPMLFGIVEALNAESVSRGLLTPTP
jgi:hypothetical protein